MFMCMFTLLVVMVSRVSERSVGGGTGRFSPVSRVFAPVRPVGLVAKETGSEFVGSEPFLFTTIKQTREEVKVHVGLRWSTDNRK